MQEDWMAVVLAGGIGTRLFPLTKEMPKPLIPIGNRPMIECTINMLINAGVKKIVIAANYLGEQISQWVETQDFGDNEIIVSNDKSKDTADAVRLAARFIDRNFIITMADIITNLDLTTAIQFHRKYNPMVTICLKPVDLPGQFGLTMIDNQHRIHLFLEKPTPHELLMTTLTFTARSDTLHMQSNLANIGIYVCDKQLIKILLDFGDLMDFGKNVFPFLLDHKHDVRGFLSNPYWMDAGTFSKYIWANNDLARGWGYPYIPVGEENETGIWVGNEIEMSPDVVLIPPCVIGNKVTIDNGSIIGPFVTIGPESMIGKNVKLKQVVALSSSKIGDNTSLEMSILSNNVTIEKNLKLQNIVVPRQVVVDDSNISSIIEKYGWK
ncbi:MAG: sugar phosphate nucleotidyltransferase [Candidatus Kariarchaeaceae archaeon]|jgi:NDP-sugar pyrophosphorylase family protein